MSKRARGGKSARRPDPDDSMQAACRRAIDIAGGASVLARALGRISSNAICKWLVVPAERVLDVERLTGVSRFELRPDIYGDVDLAELAIRRFRRTRGEVAA